MLRWQMAEYKESRAQGSLILRSASQGKLQPQTQSYRIWTLAIP